MKIMPIDISAIAPARHDMLSTGIEMTSEGTVTTTLSAAITTFLLIELDIILGIDMLVSLLHVSLYLARNTPSSF